MIASTTFLFLHNSTRSGASSQPSLHRRLTNIYH